MNMTRIKTGGLALAAMIVTPILFSGTVLAEGEMSFKGTLIEPPDCTINGGQTIVVDFGNEVMTSRVDGQMYSKPVEHGLKCDGLKIPGMKLKIEGIPASFDDKSLKTSNEHLAIQISADSKPLSINTWLKFDHGTTPQIPKLTVVPLKKKDGVLKGGEFTATATMKIDYE
ncbi:fimbrial protein [Serratia liquefaciens]|uniref:fimbrial protein n=1 Tax=Serratia liquefaciens TaxID=614 RepID=UPI00165D0154|nr:fimbrial protein [Serratia liquefaciens]QNQ55446.1 fimbrial protein [Serratia liquefaciens]